ncbi:TetR/AcrR family transcriptional regulator [Rhodococcus antarcticus]|uniref:TetR/AcrR family transcriptional regulator n=1 Tax=Rhodococcus antarcticus TaxID=2987751 RepID=A0ABY6NWN2_9NOCA|nr:TetR/AcrR family transcriptional regulator [Rhodococcus antarcticus]UZJ23644.1 TetR/AcrR family transcriptional regulator [Rhodococcus antarcticus]
MARPAKYTADQILDAARDATVVHWRDTTITHVAKRVGAPVGSIYHRFPSRDALFGSLWARSIRRFHEGLVVAAEIEDPVASMAAMARHIPQFCRENPGEAKAMTLYRLPDLLQKVPVEQRAELATINDDVDAGLRRVTARRYVRLTDQRYRLALVGTRQCPYGLVRPLIGGDVPREFDEICVAATEGILALGD